MAPWQPMATKLKWQKQTECLNFRSYGGYMREKTLERKLVMATKEMGGICPKFVSPGFDGMPDRIVLLPGGK
jgi:hypothetical protein